MEHNRRTGKAVAAGALFSTMLLAGCVTSMQGYSGVDNEGKREYLTYAASETPVCLTMSGTPFVGDDQAAAVVAGYASGAILGSPARFTDDCESTAHPDYRIVIFANASVVGSPDQLCEEAPIPTHQIAGKLRLDAAFCAKTEPLSTAWSEAPAPAGLNDPVFRRMIRTTMNELFPVEKERKNDRDGFRISAIQ